MLNQNQIQEIREKLEASQNPLFFFDNDVDGLCAFLILRKALNRGRGVPIKTFPDLKEQYLRKIDELNPDAIFVLDKAEVSAEFIDGANQRNVPIIWIDHHESKTPKEIIEKTSYFNSYPTSEPTTYIAQKIWNNKKEQWLAMIGCVGDAYLPDFAEEFGEENSELFHKNISAFDALYTTEIGKIVQMLNFGLMDTTTNVISLIKYLFNANNAYDILEENKSTKQLHKRYSELKEFLERQIKKSESEIDEKSNAIIFSYSGDTSMSSEIANKLYFKHKDKLVVVAFKKPDKINISIRGKKALEITKKIVKEISDSTGGGHSEATGLMIPLEEFENFKKKVIEFAK